MTDVTMTLEEARKVHRNFQLLAIGTIGIIAIGSVVMHYLEKLSWINAFYFSVVSLTTVGYGDIVPKTDSGKLFVSFYLMAGVGIIATFATNLIRGSRARHIVHKAERNS